MSGRVDVLAAMDGWCRLIAHTSGNPNAPDDLREARAAVADLVEAAGAFTRGMPLAYADNAAVVGNSNARLIEDMRAALARCGGEP